MTCKCDYDYVCDTCDSFDRLDARVRELEARVEALSMRLVGARPLPEYPLDPPSPPPVKFRPVPEDVRIEWDRAYETPCPCSACVAFRLANGSLPL